MLNATVLPTSPGLSQRRPSALGYSPIDVSGEPVSASHRRTRWRWTTVIYDPLAGSWTYRSFINRPDLMPDLDPEHIVKDDVDKWARYLFGQGGDDVSSNGHRRAHGAVRDGHR
jgi:hypothetical protein